MFFCAVLWIWSVVTPQGHRSNPLQTETPLTAGVNRFLWCHLRSAMADVDQHVFTSWNAESDSDRHVYLTAAAFIHWRWCLSGSNRTWQVSSLDLFLILLADVCVASRDLPADSGTPHGQREGRDLLPPLLPECRRLQRGPGGASSDEEGVWERGGGPPGQGFSTVQLSAPNRPRVTPPPPPQTVTNASFQLLALEKIHPIRKKSSIHFKHTITTLVHRETQTLMKNMNFVKKWDTICRFYLLEWDQTLWEY